MTRGARLAVLAALATAASASAGWTPPLRVSAPGNVSAPRVGIDARGATTFSWLRRGAAGTRVQLRRRTPAGRLGAVVDLSSPRRTARHLELAVAPGGRAVVAWSVQGRSGPADFVARALRASGEPGPAVVFARAQLRNAGPRVVVDASGDAVLMWAQRAGTAFAVMARRWPAGGKLGPAVEISATAPATGFDAASVAVDANGDALFAWGAVGAKDTRIVVRPWPRSGSPGAIRVVSKQGDYVQAPEVALAADGSGIVAWGAEPPDSGGVNVNVRRRSATGAFGRVHDLGIGDHHVGLALGPDGTAYVTGSYDVDPEGDVSAATLSPSGVVAETEAFTSNYERIRIGARSEDGAVLVWSHRGAASVISRTLSRSGVLGAPVRVSPPSRPTREPAIALDAEGRAQVVWIGGRGANRVTETASGP